MGQVIKPQHVTSELPLLDGLSEGENADGKDIRAAFEHLKQIFDIVRLVDPTHNVVMEVDDKGILRQTDQHCLRFLGERRKLCQLYFSACPVTEDDAE